MGISDISGKLASIVATTPRLTTLESVLQASLSLTHAPVSSRMPMVGKLGEAAVSRQAVDSPNQPVLNTAHDSPGQLQHSAAPVLTHLSKTAGFLSSLLPPQEKGIPTRAAIPATARPILDEPPSYPAPLAIALQSNLQESGLFYESHLFNWYQGQYPRDLLLKEPQSGLAQLPLPANANSAADKLLQGLASTASPDMQAQPDSHISDQSDRVDDNAQAMKSLPSPIQEAADAARQIHEKPESADKPGFAAKEQLALAPQSSEAAKLITQQLLLLDKPSLEWSVNMWPGQTATMLIEEEPAPIRENHSSWSTTIQLDFPTLGHVEIMLRMDAEGVRVRLDAANEQALPALMGQRPLCLERLASTGCRVRELSIGSSHADA
ncbi:MAG: flagellar hook-length control protein FliK [Hydrogenophilaceae bacterium]|nr:flagellar hook-length control protein FliK [Hydrogenophilaceae bacterium]